VRAAPITVDRENTCAIMHMTATKGKTAAPDYGLPHVKMPLC
jgi:hypothetical protein